MAAKVGSTPWKIQHIPFSQKPTMIAGLYTTTKGRQPLVSFSSTVNNLFSRYWTYVEKYQETEKKKTITSIFKKAFTEFAQYNKINPANVIIFREGSSEG